MKLNYYMRGLGIGIVVTALLMGIALSGRKEKMTDEEIRQRALEMGMVDGNVVLADLPDNKAKEEGQKENEEEEPLASLSDNEIADNGDAAGDMPAENPEQENNNETVNEIITISITSGDGSRVVANKLLQAGLIDDAAAYDAFLCQNGYDKRLKTGKHDIPAGASNEEIAAVVTQKGY